MAEQIKPIQEFNWLKEDVRVWNARRVRMGVFTYEIELILVAVILGLVVVS